MYSQDVSSIVLDMGSLTTRAGYAGDDTPKFVCPSFIGQIKETMEIEDTNSCKNISGTCSLYALRDRIDIFPVYHRGKILDYELYETLVRSILTKDMRFNFEEYSFVLPQSNSHNRSQREKIAQIFYESLNIKNLFFCKNAVLSCFATGRSTGLILDSGAYSTETTTVHDGFALAKSNKLSVHGGQSLTQEVGNYLQKELGVNIDSKSTGSEKTNEYFKRQLLRNIKEYAFKVDEAAGNDTTLIEYQLPDRQIVRIDRNHIVDPFFSSYGADPTYRGVHYLINDNINLCDIDIKKELYNNIIVTGGNSLLGGFVSKLQAKLAEIMVPQKAKFISFPFPTERKFSTWIGGSVLSSVTSFQSFFVGKQQWSEAGISIIEKKCA